MGIVFFCQSCGARFEVDRRMAGKKGRCRKCGQFMLIPRAEELASMSSAPAISVAVSPPPSGVRVAPARPSASDDGTPPSIGAWLKTGISQVGLVPLSAEKLPRIPSRPSALDDAEDSEPYRLARPMVEDRGPVRVQDFFLVRLWRREIGGLHRVFRWLNESAYALSIPFLMILLFGTAVKSRPMALLGATFVVLLNLGRLVAGLVDLVLVPLRDGFDVRKLRKPARRVAEPIVTIILVVLGFTFIPWLSGGQNRRDSLPRRIRAGATSLEKDIQGEVGEVLGKARRIDVQGLGTRAHRQLEELGDKSGNETPVGSPPHRPGRGND